MEKIKQNQIDIMSLPPLISAEDICAKLGVTRTTLARWRNRDSSMSTGMLPRIKQHGMILGDITPFPEPLLRVGGSAKWAVSDVNEWLNENSNKSNRRGFAGLGLGFPDDD